MVANVKIAGLFITASGREQNKPISLYFWTSTWWLHVTRTHNPPSSATRAFLLLPNFIQAIKAGVFKWCGGARGPTFTILIFMGSFYYVNIIHIRCQSIWKAMRAGTIIGSDPPKSPNKTAPLCSLPKTQVQARQQEETCSICQQSIEGQDLIFISLTTWYGFLL